MNRNKYGLKIPFFALAPMANISTYPFASQCAKFGADLVFSPMIFSDAIIHNPEEILKIADLHGIKNYIIQILGYDPKNIVKAVEIIEKGLNPFGIDLNFGCPDKNVVKSGCGGAMLKDTKRLLSIVKAVRSTLKLPLSVKTRSGYDNSNQIFNLAKTLEKEGIDMLTVHPRTVKQGFRGRADWEIIKKLKQKNKNTGMLICGSGDILTWQEAMGRQKETSADGIMIGRGALGRPWIFKEIKEQRDYNYTTDEIKKLTLDLAEKAEKIWGEKGIIESRKHFAAYFKGFPGAQGYRKNLMTGGTTKEIKDILSASPKI